MGFINALATSVIDPVPAANAANASETPTTIFSKVPCIACATLSPDCWICVVILLRKFCLSELGNPLRRRCGALISPIPVRVSSATIPDVAIHGVGRPQSVEACLVLCSQIEMGVS